MGGTDLEREVAELRKYRRFVEVAYDSVWVLDTGGRVIYVSPVFGTGGAQKLDNGNLVVMAAVEAGHRPIGHYSSLTT